MLSKCIPQAILMSLALAGTASAAAPDCKNAMTTVDMNACAALDAKAVEATLNTRYQAAMKSPAVLADPAVKKALLAAQRAWITFREADCKAVYAMWSGGTIRNVMFSSCMRKRAEQRIKELDEFANPG